MRPVHQLLALLVVVLWGVNFIFIEFGLRDWPPLLLVAARFTLVILPAIFFVRFPRGSLRRILLIGVFMSAGQFGLLYTAIFLGLPVGLSSIVLQIQAAFTVLVAALTLREIPSRRQTIGILIGLVGLAVIGLSLQASVPVLSFIVVIGAALSWAIGNVIARGVKPGTTGIQMTVWSALVVPVPMLALSLLIDGPAEVGRALTHPTWGVLASVVYTAGVASLIGYVIWNSLLARFPASQVAPFTLLVPLIGVLAAWLVLGDRPTVPELIGGALLLLGVAVTTGALKMFARTLRRRRVILREEPEGVGVPSVPGEPEGVAEVAAAADDEVVAESHVGADSEAVADRGEGANTGEAAGDRSAAAEGVSTITASAGDDVEAADVCACGNQAESSGRFGPKNSRILRP